MESLNFFWLIPALLFFILSKLFSAIRLSGLLENIGITLGHSTNLRLYFKGMFYSLFLPGGIGGDAFKTFVLNKYKQAPLKKIVGTMLYDRLSGLIMLCFLASLLGALVWLKYDYLLLVFSFLVIPLGYVFTRILFPSHKGNYLTSQLLSFGVQVGQLASVVCILNAVGISLLSQLQYLFLFLISSVASVIPFTVGGAGARELVFLYGQEILPIQAERGIAVGMLFFILTAVASLIGAFIRLHNKNKDQ